MSPRVRRGSRCGSARQRGQAMVEWFVAAPVLILLVGAVLQFSLIFTAKNTLNQAAFQAVRAATLAHGSMDALKRGFAEGLAPLLPNGQSGAAGYAESLARARVDVSNPLKMRLVVLNPTAAALKGWARPVDEQGTVITEVPNAGLAHEPAGGALEGRQTLQAANLLSVQVHYCEPMQVPFVRQLLGAVMSRIDAGWNGACYAQDGMPLVLQSTQLMQSALYPSNIQAYLGTGAGATTVAGSTPASHQGGGLGGQPVGNGGTYGGGSGGNGGSGGGGGNPPPHHICIS